MQGSKPLTPKHDRPALLAKGQGRRKRQGWAIDLPFWRRLYKLKGGLYRAAGHLRLIDLLVYDQLIKLALTRLQ